MKTFLLILVLLAIASAGCQTAPPLPAASPPAPTTALRPATDTPAVRPAPTVNAAPPANAKPAIDKDFKDPTEPWCKNAASYSYGDFFCDGDGYHLVAKGGNIATNYDGSFKNFIAEATMRITGQPPAYLGITYELITPEVEAREGITGTTGALLGEVVAGGGAALAGLQPRDVISAVVGTPVDAQHDLAALIAQAKPGDELTMTVVRGTPQGPTAAREVKVKLLERTPDKWWGGYGVVFRGSYAKNTFYVFEITAGGRYRLGLWSASDWKDLIPWTDSPAIKQGGNVWNTLKVVAEGPNLALFVNGEQLAAARDDTQPQGPAGPVALDAHAVVDTFKVWELP